MRRPMSVSRGRRKNKKEKERKKTLRRKEKLGTITPDERKELASLEAK